MTARPTHRWNEYNQHVRDWIAQLLQIPGAVSFMAYRTTDGASPDTITMLEFRTVEDARKAQESEQMQRILDGLRSSAWPPGSCWWSARHLRPSHFKRETRAALGGQASLRGINQPRNLDLWLEHVEWSLT